tara:strand:+ start:2419 stop:3396 length:978 start_codon:yes stop_codon:yes gene_type:complete
MNEFFVYIVKHWGDEKIIKIESRFNLDTVEEDYLMYNYEPIKIVVGWHFKGNLTKDVFDRKLLMYAMKHKYLQANKKGKGGKDYYSIRILDDIIEFLNSLNSNYEQYNSGKMHQIMSIHKNVKPSMVSKKVYESYIKLRDRYDIIRSTDFKRCVLPKPDEKIKTQIKITKPKLRHDIPAHIKNALLEKIRKQKEELYMERREKNNVQVPEYIKKRLDEIEKKRLNQQNIPNTVKPNNVKPNNVKPNTANPQKKNEEKSELPDHIKKMLEQSKKRREQKEKNKEVQKQVEIDRMNNKEKTKNLYEKKKDYFDYLFKLIDNVDKKKI